jgi:hypothetical protein
MRASNVVSAGGLSATAAHGIVCICDMVTAQAQAGDSGWVDYSAVFLSAEVQDLILARLRGHGSGSPQPEGEAAGLAGDILRGRRTRYSWTSQCTAVPTKLRTKDLVPARYYKE